MRLAFLELMKVWVEVWTSLTVTKTSGMNVNPNTTLMLCQIMRTNEKYMSYSKIWFGSLLLCGTELYCHTTLGKRYSYSWKHSKVSSCF